MSRLRCNRLGLGLEKLVRVRDFFLLFTRFLRTVGVVACTLVSHPSDPGSIPTVTNVENPFLLIVLG